MTNVQKVNIETFIKTNFLTPFLSVKNTPFTFFAFFPFLLVYIFFIFSYSFPVFCGKLYWKKYAIFGVCDKYQHAESALLICVLGLGFIKAHLPIYEQKKAMNLRPILDRPTVQITS